MGEKTTYELRADLERDFVAALLAGLARRDCDPGDALAVCPVEMLTEGGIPWAIYRAIEQMQADGLRPTVHGVYAHIMADKKAGGKGWPDIGAEDVAAMACSNFGYDDGIRHYAALVRREGLKRKAESALVALVTNAQRYGNDPAEMAMALTALAVEMEGGAPEICAMADLVARVRESVENGSAAKPLPMPWATLNRVLKGGLVPGELAVLAARPGIGKTALAGCLAVETARAGKGVLFVSREVRDVTLASRMMAREGRIDARYFRQGIERAENILPAIRNAEQALAPLPLRIVEKSTAPMTPREVRRLAKTTANLGLVIIDYLQLLTPDQKHNSREREVADMSRCMKQLALDCDCPVLLLSQLNRRVEESDRCPMLSDLRESGAIEQDADIVMFLHTKRSNLGLPVTPVQVEVAKGRSSGTGTAYLTFEKPFANFAVDRNAESWRAKTRREGNDL